MELTEFQEEDVQIHFRRKLINRIVGLISTIVYLSTAIYGLAQCFNPEFSRSQAILILSQGLAAALIPLAFEVGEKLFKIRIHYALRIFIILYSMLAIVFGEAMQFYYSYSWWDSFLHALSGIWITLTAGFIVLHTLKSYTGEHKLFLCISISIMVSLSAAFLWEIYEFTFDTLFGTNMQKFLPEADGLFNGGNTKDILDAADETIAGFYRSPSGYRYALMDTMKDMVCCTLGTTAGSFCLFLIFRLDKVNLFSDIVMICHKNKRSKDLKEENEA